MVKLNGSIPKDAYVMLIGAMKCGTTSLFTYLKAHPQICPSIVKEPEYFSVGTQNKKIVDEKTAHVEFYEDLWTFDPSRHRYALEASTGYTKFPEHGDVAERIYQTGIQPRIIYVVRNPYDRIESHLNHMLKKGQKNRRLEDIKFIDFSNYYKQLQQYTKYFPKEHILILNYDVLNKNPAECLQIIYRFLGLPDDYFPRKYHRQNVMRQTSAIGAVLDGPTIKKIFGKKRKYLIYIADRFFPPPDRPRLTPEERTIVYKALNEDMQKLQKEFGVDVKSWGF